MANNVKKGLLVGGAVVAAIAAAVACPVALPLVAELADKLSEIDFPPSDTMVEFFDEFGHYPYTK